MAQAVLEYTSIEEAITRVRSTIRGWPRAEAVDPQDSFGRTLAEDVIAMKDIPGFPTSHMDGYAVASAGLKGASSANPVVLKIVGSTGPGEPSPFTIGRGECARVATGAGIPTGADAVTPVESVVVRGRNVTIGFPPEPGSHIFKAGEDITKGELLLKKGRAVRAIDVGLVIGLGRRVRVFRRPRVSILPTGTELAPAGRPEPGKVTESHSPVFQRLCEAQGCEASALNIVGDDPDKLSRALKQALASSDLVVTLGGTSAGRRDLVIDAVSRLRPGVLIHGLKLDRGRVTGVASIKGKPVLMLPGPIQAAMNAFLVVGTPLIEGLSGRKQGLAEVQCVLTEEWEARKRFRDFQKVVYVKLRPGNPMEAQPLSGETESMRLLTDSDGYFVVPEPVTRLDKGGTVNVRFIPGQWGH